MNEISPKHLTGVFGSSHQLCVTIGSLAAALIGLIPPLPITKDEARDTFVWRIGYSIPLFLAIVQVILITSIYRFESPSFYITKGNIEIAKTALSKIYIAERDVTEVLNELSGAKEETPEVVTTEKSLNKHVETRSLYSMYKQAFWIGLILPALQQLTGINAIMFYANTIFKKQTEESTARILNIIVMVTNLLFTFVSTFTSDKIGRRLLLIAGSIGCGIGLFVAGLCFSQFQDDASNSLSGFSLIFDIAIFFFVASFGLSHGPIW